MRTLLLCFFMIPILSLSQWNNKDTTTARTWIAFEYGANWPQADLANRYGFLNHIGTMIGFKTSKNWFYGLQSTFHFGKNVRISGLFDHLVDSYGNITDVNGDIATVLVFPRGFNINVNIGKIFPVFGSNQNSGIFIHSGIGYLLHRMKIETNEQVIPQIELDY